MLPVQMRTTFKRNVKLASVRIRSRIGHTQNTPFRMFLHKVLIIKHPPHLFVVVVDRMATCANTHCDISALTHKAVDEAE